MIQYDRYKDGKRNVLTMSYDDGRIYDRRLVEIFNKYGIRATFHLSSSKLGEEGYISPDEVGELYKGHEVSCHTVHHPDLCSLPPQCVINEIYEDRKALEKLCGYIVRGMSWPFSNYNDEVISIAAQCGIKYVRCGDVTKAFYAPDNFMAWTPTCHHRDCLALASDFLKREGRSSLFYVWGHSYEFDLNNNFDTIEEFCKIMGGNETVWYATNIEIYDYIMAQRALHISADCKKIYNPSVIDVWLNCDEKTVKIPSGETVVL